MQVPAALSYFLPAIPVVGRTWSIVLCWRAACQLIDPPAKRREEHRSTLFALAGFALAGIAIIATQAAPRFGAALFDLVFGFVLYLAAIGVQAWKERWLHDLAGDALRDAGTTSMLLFVVRLAQTATTPAAPGNPGTFGWSETQAVVVACCCIAAWLVGPGAQLVLTAKFMCDRQGELRGSKAKRPAEQEAQRLSAERSASEREAMGLIRFRGHRPKGGYGVRHGAREGQAAAA